MHFIETRKRICKNYSLSALKVKEPLLQLEEGGVKCGFSMTGPDSNGAIWPHHALVGQTSEISAQMITQINLYNLSAGKRH